jgi:hypothetical protein
MSTIYFFASECIESRDSFEHERPDNKPILQPRTYLLWGRSEVPRLHLGSYAWLNFWITEQAITEQADIKICHWQP